MMRDFIWPQYKEKCPHCGRDRYFLKNVPLSCKCQWMKIIDEEKRKADFIRIHENECDSTT